MAAGGDDLRVADADPGDPVDRDRPLVIGQRIGWAAAEPAQGLVEAGDHRRQGAVPGRDDDPEALQASQAHHSSVSRPPIRGPWPQSNWSHMPGSGIHGRYTRRWPAAYARLALATARLRRPLRALEAEREQLVVDDVGPDLAVAALDPLLDLGQIAVDQPVPGRSLGQDPAGGSQPDVSRDGVVRAARPARPPPGSCRSDRTPPGSPRRPRPSSPCPPRLLTPPRSSQAGWAGSVAADGQIRWPRPGRFVTGYGQFPVAVVRAAGRIAADGAAGRGYRHPPAAQPGRTATDDRCGLPGT